MRGRFGLTATAVLLVAFAAAGAAERRVTFTPEGDTLRICVGDRALATYVYRDATILRPYFKDVCAPGGIQVTRQHPPREGADPADHTTMHPGLWLAFGDLGGADFWRNKAAVEHGGFVEPPRAEGEKGTFTVRNRYVAEGKVLCEETCAYTFRAEPAGYWIHWDSTFVAQQPGLSFGDQEEMGLGVRVATPIMVKPFDSRARSGRILDDQGRQNEKAIWGEQAAWCDYSGRLGDVFAGIMVMADPRNASECRWHVRDYGLMVANPFGRSVFKKGPVNRTELKPGEPFHLRFGILLHATVTPGAFQPVAAYQDYLKIVGPGFKPDLTGLGTPR